MQSVAQIDLLLLRSAGKEILFGVPRAFRHEAAQRGEPAATRGRTHRAYCNAPYARVLRARITRISAGLGPVPVGAGVAFLGGNWHQTGTDWGQCEAKCLISFGTMEVPVT
ncbi:hypothetical protein SAMN05518849_13412 [Sphingobium sp. AP50]|nr:hypothetical protein SAMN05518849_13412 [Sphingobium sp. AP50]